MQTQFYTRLFLFASNFRVSPNFLTELYYTYLPCFIFFSTFTAFLKYEKKTKY